MATSVHFSQRVVSSLTVPDGEPHTDFRDDTARFLYLRVTPAGKRTWYHVQRRGKRMTWTKIGTHPEHSPEDARRASTMLAAEFTAAAGLPARITFGRLWQRWFYEHAKPRLRSVRLFEGYHRLYLLPFETRAADAITRDEMVALHRSIGETHRTMANNVLNMVRCIYQWGIDLGILKDNPCSAVTYFPKIERERFLDASELSRLLDALDSYRRPDFADFVRLALFTGARSANLRAMAWADIDFDGCVWHISAAAAKNGKPMTVALTGPAMEVLAKRRGIGPASPWVFPAASASGHMVNSRTPWLEVCTAAGLSNVHVHDLRRTLGSWQAAGGTSLVVIGKSLGHRSTAATAIYARMNLDPVRASVEAAVGAMMATRASHGTDSASRLRDPRLPINPPDSEP